MCGIHLALYFDTESHEIKYVCPCMSRIQKRGPDAHSTVYRSLNENLQAVFSGFTLHFQGQITCQPLCGPDGFNNILLWNGEVFGGIETGDSNDGMVLLRLLHQCQSESDILSLLAKVRGPWAFIYWQESLQRLYFGRDVFGRRSLLYHHSTNSNPSFVLSSVATENHSPWKEIPARGIYVIDFSTQKSCLEMVMFPWIVDTTNNSHEMVKEFKDSGECFHQTLEDISSVWQDVKVVPSSTGITVPFGAFNDDSTSECDQWKGIGESVTSDDLPSLQQLASPDQHALSEQLIAHLSEAVKVRVENQSHLCHDCITAALSGLSMHGQGFRCNESTGESLDKNLQGTSGRSSYVSQTIKGGGTKLCNDQTNSDSFVRTGTSNVECDSPSEKSAQGDGLSLFDSDKNIQGVNGRSIEVIEKLQRLDITCDQPESCNDQTNFGSSVVTGASNLQCDSSHENTEAVCSGKLSLLDSGKRCGHARIGILYSGGIDSLMLAALTDRFVPRDEPIDLLNVAFEQRKAEVQRSKKLKPKNDIQRADETKSFDVPDRITGREGLEQLNPDRVWNFVEINITLEELKSVREESVRKLVYPLNTVLDDSIGCAIWFAARGRGVLTQGEATIPYTTSARVLLVGMGADEQFVGYSRHRVKYKTEGLAGLVSEIKMEIERISARNLGRDDRVISDHSRESRFPFLDEGVVSFLNSLPITQKANLELPRGIGDKFLLRLAAEKVGLTKSCTLAKRAIQFGSRIAKAENKKEKASDICNRL